MEIINDWNEEKRSAYLYQIMSKHEKNLQHKLLFSELAAAANKQAAIWAQKIKDAGDEVPLHYQPDLRARVISWLIQLCGTKRLRYVLPTMKVRGMSIYMDPSPLSPFPTQKNSLEQRHKSITNGGNLRAAVFGVNDGLISNASLLLGITGANAPHHLIILSGIAGLLAGACSMAAGEYVSVSSQRELYEYQIELERKELEIYPDEEAAELAMIYQARGLPKEEAQRFAKLLISMPDKALDTLAKEELGLNPQELGSPWGAALSSFFSFTCGAAIPLVPYCISNASSNLPVMIGVTAFALFTIGAALSLFTNRSAMASGLRMLLIGTAAGSMTYAVGSLLGVALH
jgi:VIT1/CCC1 family predicted Fe2+/Mn2+ transporter